MNNNIIELLKVYKFSEKIRLGSNSDGGYVIAVLDGDYDCYISAGIGAKRAFQEILLINII